MTSEAGPPPKVLATIVGPAMPCMLQPAIVLVAIAAEEVVVDGEVVVVVGVGSCLGKTSAPGFRGDAIARDASVRKNSGVKRVIFAV